MIDLEVKAATRYNSNDMCLFTCHFLFEAEAAVVSPDISPRGKNHTLPSCFLSPTSSQPLRICIIFEQTLSIVQTLPHVPAWAHSTGLPQIHDWPATRVLTTTKARLAAAHVAALPRPQLSMPVGVGLYVEL